LWSSEKGVKLKGTTGGTNSVSFSPDGKLLAATSETGEVHLWNTTTKEVRTIKAHQGKAFSLAFSADNKRLATGGEDHMICLIELSTLSVTRLKGHSLAVTVVVFSPDGEFLTSGGEDRTVRLWDKEGKQIKILSHYGEVASLHFLSPRSLLSAGGGVARIWDLDNWQSRGFSSTDLVVNAIPSREQNSLFVLSIDRSLLSGTLHYFEDKLPHQEIELREWINANLR
jgi:WD40 repeat protein